MRLRETTYRYDDPRDSSRVTGTIESPAYSEEDRALVMALRAYEARPKCKCGEPIEVAWHSEMDGFYEAQRWVCHACTALNNGTPTPGGMRLVNTRPASKGPMPPFELGKTTTEYEPPAHPAA